tara:strand:- start:116 stop:436 length:321 start_codon:yes stop_codon:yes gene_type:complete
MINLYVILVLILTTNRGYTMTIENLSFHKELNIVGNIDTRKNGIEIQNPFSGVTSIMTPEEEAVYSFIMGVQMVDPDPESYLWERVREGLDWFRKNNPQVYMDQLD